MIKKETFNYNLLTQTFDKISYIIIMNFVSIAFAIGIIWLFFMIKNHIIINLFPLCSNFFEVFTSICLTALLLPVNIPLVIYVHIFGRDGIMLIPVGAPLAHKILTFKPRCNHRSIRRLIWA